MPHFFWLKWCFHIVPSMFSFKVIDYLVRAGKYNLLQKFDFKCIFLKTLFFPFYISSTPFFSKTSIWISFKIGTLILCSLMEVRKRAFLFFSFITYFISLKSWKIERNYPQIQAMWQISNKSLPNQKFHKRSLTKLF